MQRTLIVSVLACLTQLAPIPETRASERARINPRTGLFEPPLADLRKAAERGDRAELARAAGRVAPARLAKALAEPDRRLVLAVLEAIPLVAPGITLLEQVLPLIGAADQAMRERAVGTTATLLGTSDANDLAEYEIPTAVVRAACQALASTAANERESVTTRLLAVQGQAEAAAACAGSFNPAVLLASPVPDIRRAAVLTLPAGPAANDRLLDAARDSDGRVAAAAGARLCSRKVRLPPGLPPLGRLALAQGAAPEDVIDILPCLVAAKAPADQEALAKLRQVGPAAIRDAIKNLMPPAAKSAPP
ncbi:MAG: hypothetical protein JXP73_00525 [Deltaproteobacteria bacterium]|nr:hypothetical protein [Deltaproteobacteria bacterium]